MAHDDRIKPPETVRELFSNITRYADFLGQGRQAMAYRFKPMEGMEGIENFVIRVPHTYLDKRDLKKTTALVPIKHIVSHINIGNRLMELNYPINHRHLAKNNSGEYINSKGQTLSDPKERISISLFQEGSRLRQEWDYKQHINQHDNRDELPVYSHIRATIDTVNLIKSLVEEQGFNPYTRMFKKAYALIHIGLEPDISLDNILYNKKNKTLRMVDQENRLLKKPIKSEAEAEAILKKVGETHFEEFSCQEEMVEFLGGERINGVMTRPKELEGLTNLQLAEKVLVPQPPTKHSNPELYEQYKRALGDILTLLQKAGKEAMRTDPGRDDPDGSKLPAIPRRIEFADTKSIQMVTLKDPPKVLLEQLKQIVKNADITR